ncbi:MAG: hypothetical protein R3C11_06795 [Planctomycetaceae bacterium]
MILIGKVWIPDMLLDPSPESDEAVQKRAINEAKELKVAESDQTQAAYEKALSGAVDNDQVQEIVKPLEELGVKINLQKHFGFLTKWYRLAHSIIRA